MLGPWVDPADPAVIAIIAGPGADPANPEVQAQVTAAVAEASEVLSALTGWLVHPAGEVTEDYTAVPYATRLTPTWRPVREIIDVLAVIDCATFDVRSAWCLFGNEVVLIARWARMAATSEGWRDIWLACGCASVPERLRMTYKFGSTVTVAARAALLDYAHQLHLRDTDLGECQLPERVTSVTREGLSYTMIDPQNYLDKGRTGVPSVDAYLATVNPSRAKRPAAVYTPDSPPGVSVITRWAG